MNQIFKQDVNTEFRMSSDMVSTHPLLTKRVKV